MNFLKVIIAGLGALGMLFTGHQAPTLGSAVPSIQALFETSLQASLTTNATSATLVSGTDLAGNLLNGYYCFTVDAGTTQNEFMCGNASGTALTNLVRGVNPVLGIVSNVSLEQSHRRGADVKMTDAPYLSIYSNIFNGSSSIPGILQYDSSLAPTSTIGSNPYNIPDVAFVASTSFAGTVNASVIQKGISQISTQAQMATHTAVGSTGALLVDQTANDSLTASTSPIGVVASGTLDPSFLAGGNYNFKNVNVSGTTNLVGTTTIASVTSSILQTDANGIISGTQINTFTKVIATSTTAVPNGVSSTIISIAFPPTVASNTIYSIAGIINGASWNTAGVNQFFIIASSTAVKSLVASCYGNLNGLGNFIINGNMQMLSSTTQELLAIQAITSATSTFCGGYLSGSFYPPSTTLQIVGYSNGSTPAETSTLSIISF